jgi:hypothetical protein
MCKQVHEVLKLNEDVILLCGKQLAKMDIRKKLGKIDGRKLYE